MMSACCGTEVASMHAAVGEKIVGRQLECGRTAFQLYIYDMMTSKCTCPVVQDVGRIAKCMHGVP